MNRNYLKQVLDYDPESGSFIWKYRDDGPAEFNDAALVRLADYEALQAECEKLRKAIRRLCNIYVVDDYYSGDIREERLSRAVERAIDAAMEKKT